MVHLKLETLEVHFITLVSNRFLVVKVNYSLGGGAERILDFM